MTSAVGITIQVNGKDVELQGDPTVADWLDGLGRDPRTVAIERNGDIVGFARMTARADEVARRIEALKEGRR